MLKRILGMAVYMVNLSQDLKPISYVKAHITEVVDYIGLVQQLG
jgi:hypothetical protein